MVVAQNIQASWIVNSYDLIFNPGEGGEVSETSRKVTFGKAYENSYNETNNTTSVKDLPIPTREGCIFLGWYTSKEGGDAVNRYTIMSEEGAEIYAHWLETWTVKTTITKLNAEYNDRNDKGTPENPYLISNAEELAFFAKQLQNKIGDYYKYSYKQTSVIDLSRDSGNKQVDYVWQAIGFSSTTAFCGTYDGQGFAILNLKTTDITNASTGLLRDYQGLFGYTTNATLKNINIINGKVYGENFVGAVAGFMNGGSISNCRNGAEVEGKENCGLVGSANCVKVTTCYNYGTINGTKYVGGVVGYAQSGGEKAFTHIENCYSKCVVTATSDAGGITGYASSYTKISACGFNGDVTASSNKASLVGQSENEAVITNCFAIITGTSDMNWKNGNGSVTNSISKLSNDTNKKYTGSDFSNWSVLETTSTQPLPAGFSLLGTGGRKLTENDINKLGYNTKVD